MVAKEDVEIEEGSRSYGPEARENYLGSMRSGKLHSRVFYS